VVRALAEDETLCLENALLHTFPEKARPIIFIHLKYNKGYLWHINLEQVSGLRSKFNNYKTEY
jgi:hypothetical protein